MQTSNEEWVEEFKTKTNAENFEVKDHSLIGDHLFDSTWYPESPYELDSYKIEEWLRTLLTTKDKEKEEAVAEARREERNDWLAGNRCSVCGESNLDSRGLSDVCGKCFEEQ